MLAEALFTGLGLRCDMVSLLSMSEGLEPFQAFSLVRKLGQVGRQFSVSCFGFMIAFPSARTFCDEPGGPVAGQLRVHAICSAVVGVAHGLGFCIVCLGCAIVHTDQGVHMGHIQQMLLSPRHDAHIVRLRNTTASRSPPPTDPADGRGAARAVGQLQTRRPLQLRPLPQRRPLPSPRLVLVGMCGCGCDGGGRGGVPGGEAGGGVATAAAHAAVGATAAA